MGPAVGNNSDDLLDSSVPDFDPSAPIIMGSTDVGDVSYVVPSACLNFAGVVKGTPGHSWQWVAQSGSPIMHDGLIHAAKVITMAGINLLNHPEMAAQAREELLSRTGGKVVSMLPPNATPDF